MRETLELRVNLDYSNLLFGSNEGKVLGSSIKGIEITTDDPRYSEVGIITERVKKEFGKSFFFGWSIKRKYTSKELNSANLFHLKVAKTFEPAGEECGTIYDDSLACEICGVGRKQLNNLTLAFSSIPKKDISRTIAGEVIVSEKFVKAYELAKLNGAIFKPVVFKSKKEGFFQLISKAELKLSHLTIAGIDPFDLSTESEGEIYKCPKGHTIGLNLLSEPYIESITENNFDFYATEQKIGIRRGLLNPQPLFLCSPAFRNLVIKEKLSGFEFEIAYLNK